MIWLITTDTAYYSTEQKVKAYIKEQTTIKSDIQIKVLPTRYEILACIKQATTQPFVMVSNMPPPDDLENFFYVLKRLDTSRLQDELIGLNDREKLTNALKMSVYDCKLNFDGFIGRELLKEKIKAYDNGVFFLLGLSGVGKSYFVEAIAGEYGIPMVDLNISLLFEKDNPLELINNMFRYFSENGSEVVLRIDEIEHMLKKESVIGEFLTILNDLNSPTGYRFNGFLVATANNITDILEQTPQMFREGRFDEKFFMSYPIESDYHKMLWSYIDQYDLAYIDMSMNKLYTYLNANHNENDRVLANKLIYSPAEVKAIVKIMAKLISSDDNFMHLKRVDDDVKMSIADNELKALCQKACEEIIPLQVNAKEGFKRMLGEAKAIRFKEV